MDTSNLLGKVYELLAFYGLKVIAAILIFVIGRWVALGVARIIKSVMVKRKTDKTLVAFVRNLSYVLLLIFVIIAALNQLGIQTASLIAIIAEKSNNNTIKAVLAAFFRIIYLHNI